MKRLTILISLMTIVLMAGCESYGPYVAPTNPLEGIPLASFPDDATCQRTRSLMERYAIERMPEDVNVDEELEKLKLFGIVNIWPDQVQCDGYAIGNMRLGRLHHSPHDAVEYWLEEKKNRGLIKDYKFRGNGSYVEVMH